MSTKDDGLAWVAAGTNLISAALTGLDEQALAAPSELPGWSRKHLVAHIAANADALCNLVHWAKTGEPTPMYSTAEQRNADIEAGAQIDGHKLVAWFGGSAARLDEGWATMTEEQWQNEVVTAQGLTRTADETPWMRTREVLIHAVDLGTGVTFADLPEDFLTALAAEIQAKRGLTELPVGPLADVAAYLAGRAHRLTDVPELGPWL